MGCIQADVPTLGKAGGVTRTKPAASLAAKSLAVRDLRRGSPNGLRSKDPRRARRLMPPDSGAEHAKLPLDQGWPLWMAYRGIETIKALWTFRRPCRGFVSGRGVLTGMAGQMNGGHEKGPGQASRRGRHACSPGSELPRGRRDGVGNLSGCRSPHGEAIGCKDSRPPLLFGGHWVARSDRLAPWP